MIIVSVTFKPNIKAAWGPGPWQGEPDHVEWEDIGSGYACLVRRHTLFGAFCGYVAVGLRHPFHGRAYDDDGPSSLQVHGGLTFAGSIADWPNPDSSGPLWATHQGPDSWFFGFDCAHHGDFMPGHDFGKSMGGEYRTLGYARQACTALAEQLKLEETRHQRARAKFFGKLLLWSLLVIGLLAWAIAMLS